MQNQIVLGLQEVAELRHWAVLEMSWPIGGRRVGTTRSSNGRGYPADWHSLISKYANILYWLVGECRNGQKLGKEDLGAG